MKVISSPSNKEARTTKKLPSLPARVQFSALAINGQWTISGLLLTNLQQPLSSHGMLRTTLSHVFHPDFRHGAIRVESITNSVVEREKSVIDNEGKSVTVIRIDFYYHVNFHANAPGQSTILRCHPKWNNDSKAGISGREWFDWIEVNWEKGDGTKSYTVPGKL